MAAARWAPKAGCWTFQSGVIPVGCFYYLAEAYQPKHIKWTAPDMDRDEDKEYNKAKAALDDHGKGYAWILCRHNVFADSVR